MKETILTVQVGQEVLECKWRVGAVRRFNLRLRGDGTLSLSTPTGTPRERAERFLSEQTPFLTRALARQRSRIPLPSDGENEAVLFGRRLPLTVLPSRRADYLLREEGITLYLPKDTPEARAVCLARLRREALSEQISRLIERHLSAAAPACPPPSFALRQMKSRWGSCRPDRGRLTFALSLALLPPPLIELVVVHELCHLSHPDHSPRFYAALDAVLPDAAERRSSLRAYRVT